MPDRNAAILLGLKDQVSAGLRTTANEAKRALSDFERLERQFLQVSDSEIRTARAAGDHAGALRLVSSQLQAAAPNTVRYNNLLVEQARIQKQIATESFSGQFLGGLKSGLLNIVGPAALATGAINGVRAVVEGGIGAAQAALALRETTNALRAVSGGAVVYADAVATARRQQVLFGGSLKDNIDGLQGLVITSRDSGAALQSLVDLSQRLELKSPEQGIGGARVALAEAFGEGNITSLARRFEIPKAKIAELRDVSIPAAEKVRILSEYLDSVGISSEAVAGKVDQTALAYRGLSAELERTSLTQGGRLADTFARQAEGLSRLFGVINGNPEALAKLVALQQGRSGIGPDDVEKQARNLRVADASKAENRAGLQLGDSQNAALDRAHNQLIVFAASSDQARDSVVALYGQLAQTGNIAAFDAGVRTLVTSQDRGTKTTKEHTDALTSNIKKMVEGQIDAAALADRQVQLEADSRLAAQGLLGAGDQADLLGKKYRLAGDDAQFLINKQQQIGNATALADQRLGERDPNNPLTLAQFNAFDRLADAGRAEQAAKDKAAADKKAADAKAAADKAAREAEQLADAQFENRLKAAKTNAQKIAVIRAREAQVSDPVERAKLEGRIIDIQNQKVGGLSKELNLRESIFDSTEKQKQAVIDLAVQEARNRLDTLKDQDELKKANAIIRSSGASENLKARARAKRDLILAEEAKRDFEIGQTKTTAGASISKSGKLLQSVPSAGGPVQVGTPTPTGAPQQVQGPQAQPTAAGKPLVITMDGKEVASIILPYAWAELDGAIQHAKITQGG